MDDTNHEQQYTHHQYNDELDLGDDFKDEIEILETESNINSSLGSKLKSILTSKSLNQYIPHQPIDLPVNLESGCENTVNKVNVSDDYSDITNSEVVPVESSLYDNIQKNFESRYLNNFIEVYPYSEINLSPQETLISLAARLDSLIVDDLEYTPSTTQKDQSESQHNESLTEEDIQYEKLIREIRSGSTVSMYYPKSDDSSSDSLSDKDSQEQETGQDNKEIVQLDGSGDGCTRPDKPEVKPFKPTKPSLIIITKKLEGDTIPPLPSWVNIQFDHKDYHIKKKVLSRMNVADYDNTNKKDSTKPSDRNQEWLEKESSYDLNTLFDSKDEKND